MLSPFFINYHVMLLQNNIHAFSMLLLTATFMSFACQGKKDIARQQSTEEILNADIAFSDMSRQVGMKKAFLRYIDEEGTLLRPDHLPLAGADAIDFISILSDTAYTLSWKPLHAEIALSGDLGYTYGIYELKLQDTILNGTYVNIWEKDKEGEWKFVLNSDNPGIR